jgi:hypothetical protein
MKESREEIRARLLRDSNVIENIQLRAYEIWILRGRVDGRHQEDWALAENEVLSFLVELELKKAPEETAAPALEVAAVEETPTETAPQTEAAPVKKTRKAAAPKTTTAKTAIAKKAASSEASAVAEPVGKKAAARKPAAKRTTPRKAASKKPAKAELPVVK